jgi:hypothetical protein
MGEVRSAMAALNALPPPASATALADRIGFEPWVVDLLYSVLGSIAITGLAAALIAFSVAAEPRTLIEAGTAAVAQQMAETIERDGAIDIEAAHAAYESNRILPRLSLGDYAVLALACAAHHGWSVVAGRISASAPALARSRAPALRQAG